MNWSLEIRRNSQGKLVLNDTLLKHFKTRTKTTIGFIGKITAYGGLLSFLNFLQEQTNS